MSENINNYTTVPEPHLTDKLVGSTGGGGWTYNWTIEQILSLSTSVQVITRNEALGLIDSNSLKPAIFYRISNAGIDNEIIIQAASTNSLFEVCANVSDIENLYRYKIATDILTLYSSASFNQYTVAATDDSNAASQGVEIGGYYTSPDGTLKVRLT